MTNRRARGWRECERGSKGLTVKCPGLKLLMGIALILGLTALPANTIYADVTGVRMSDTPGGAEMTQFPSGTSMVYVVIDYAEMHDEVLMARVYDDEGDLLFVEAKAFTGSGIESIEVTHPEGGAFPDGRHVTSLYSDGFVSKSIIWEVTAAHYRVYLPITLKNYSPTAFPTPTVTPTPTATPTPTSTSTPTPTSTLTPLPDFEQQVIELINQERGAQGLAPLHVDDRLMRAAQHHSQDMAANNFVSHTGSDGSSPWDRIEREGYPLAVGGETIAAGYLNPPSVVAGWKGSPPHWSILMGDYQDIGVGYAFNANSHFHHYWTADLAVPAGSKAVLKRELMTNFGFENNDQCHHLAERF